MKNLLFLSCLIAQFALAQAPDSVAVAKQVDSLIDISRNLAARRDFTQAFRINAQAKNLVTERFGRQSALHAGCLINEGRIYSFNNQFDEAEKRYIQAKEIREKVFGKEHPLYAANLYTLAQLYFNTGRYSEAESLWLKAKEIYATRFGEEHADYVASLNSLAILYNFLGRYSESESLHLKAKEIRSKTLGAQNPIYAGSLNNLGNLYSDMGRYSEAEPLYLETKQIWEKTLGKEHPNYALILNNLANLYWKRGHYSKAEPLCLEAKEIRSRVLGKEHSAYAESLNNLAVLYNDMGRYSEAESLYLEAKGTKEKMLGREHPDYALSLQNLALLYLNAGRYSEAEPLYVASIDIQKKAYGKNHPDYASSLFNLAFLYENMGRYSEAEPLYVESEKIRRKTIGKEHPDYAASLFNLAVLYEGMGQYSRAEPLYQEAKDIREKILGPEHPDYFFNLYQLAILYWKENKIAQAEPFFLQAMELTVRYVDRQIAFLNEKDQGLFFDTYKAAYNSYLSFAQTTHSATVTRLVFDQTLNQKGSLLQNTRQLGAFITQKGDSTQHRIYSEWQRSREVLAFLYSKPAEERFFSTDSLERIASHLETQLARSSAEFRKSRQRVRWQEVRDRLHPEEAAVEFVHYRYNPGKERDSTMYAALVLRSHDTIPAFVYLFEQKMIEPVFSATNTADYAGRLYAQRGYKAQAKSSDKSEGIGVDAQNLYALIWNPLDSLLRGVKTIYYSPSGLLHRCNLGAIATPDTQQLSDKYTLIQIGSTRQIAIPDSLPSIVAPPEAVVFGGLRYDVDSSAQEAANNSFVQTDDFAANNFATVRRSVTGINDQWDYLPATLQEAKETGELLAMAGYQTLVLTGVSGMEEYFKILGTGSKPSPRVLHIATHGFFFPDAKYPDQRAERRKLVFRNSDNPLMRSGLIFAGANRAWTTGKPYAGKDDGILTAYEISQMNLSNTELVVLSACETGLGDIRDNEGVYGLKRAFKMAGAKYILMSLWSVPDKQTQELMHEFYDNWLRNKMSVPLAFSSAQKAMREKYENPFLWAGFVLVE